MLAAPESIPGSKPPQREQDYTLSEAQIASYRKNGFIQLNDVITGAELERLREAVERAVEMESPPSNEPRNGYSSLFIQRVNLWQRHPLVKEYSQCRRFGNIAARLSGHPMRLWHDQALFKEPLETNRTPWHQDAHYWPHQQKRDQVSIWIALRDANIQNGCMSFLPGTQNLENIPSVKLNNPQDLFEIAPQVRGIRPETCELKAGSCTFHNGLTFHYAGPNKSKAMREAFAILYMPDGTTFSGAGHVCTAPENWTVGAKLEGPNYPLVSDVE